MGWRCRHSRTRTGSSRRCCQGAYFIHAYFLLAYSRRPRLWRGVVRGKMFDSELLHDDSGYGVLDLHPATLKMNASGVYPACNILIWACVCEQSAARGAVATFDVAKRHPMRCLQRAGMEAAGPSESGVALRQTEEGSRTQGRMHAPAGNAQQESGAARLFPA